MLGAMRVNVNRPLLMTRAVFAHARATPAPSSSISRHRAAGQPNFIYDETSKAALFGTTCLMAREVGSQELPWKYQ